MDRIAAIPRFYLYGEPHRVADGRFVHVENLDDRSRPSEWTIRPHAHADLNHVFHITEGGGAMQAENVILSFEAPCLLLVPAGIVHGFSWASESKGSVITVSSDYLGRLRESDPALGMLFRSAIVVPLDAADSERYHRGAKRIMAELVWAAPGHRASAESKLLDILVNALRAIGTQAEVHRSAPGRQAALVARFRERVEARFRLREPVAVHAEALKTSQTRLRAACAVIARQSPMEILDQRALVEAQRSLLYTNLSVAEIADSLGLSDAAYFSRFFSRRVGRSPRAYRAEHASGKMSFLSGPYNPCPCHLEKAHSLTCRQDTVNRNGGSVELSRQHSAGLSDAPHLTRLPGPAAPAVGSVNGERIGWRTRSGGFGGP